MEKHYCRVPEIIFWHIPSKAYKKVAPKLNIRKRCVGSIFLENVAAQEAEMGMMKVLEQRPTVKVRSTLTEAYTDEIKREVRISLVSFWKEC